VYRREPRSHGAVFIHGHHDSALPVSPSTSGTAAILTGHHGNHQVSSPVHGAPSASRHRLLNILAHMYDDDVDDAVDMFRLPVRYSSFFSN
jgi:hypothetical protein